MDWSSTSLLVNSLLGIATFVVSSFELEFELLIMVALSLGRCRMSISVRVVQADDNVTREVRSNSNSLFIMMSCSVVVVEMMCYCIDMVQSTQKSNSVQWQ